MISPLQLHQFAEKILKIFHTGIFRVTRSTCICMSRFCKKIKIFFF